MSPEAGGSGAEAEPTGGTRIKPKFATTTIAGTDGARQVTKSFVGWYDSQRNEPCSLSAAADGKTRCLPATTSIFGTYHSDATCTKPVALRSLGSVLACGSPVIAPPKYASNPVTVAGCTGARLSLVAPKLTLATWYVKSGTSCLAAGAPTDGYEVYDASGVEIPPSAFVEFSSTTQVL